MAGFSATSVAAAPLQLEGACTAEALAVASGGLKTGAACRGLAEVALVGSGSAPWSDGTLAFRASGLAPLGGDLSGTRLGDLQGASNLAAYNHPLLYELWVAGTFADDRFGVRAGRLLADSDFATTGGSVFLNSSFGWPAFISANTRNTGPAFDRSALGLFGKLTLRPGVHLQAGLYDGDTFDDAGGDPARHPNGLHCELGHGQGVFAIAELGLAFGHDPVDSDRPLKIKFGAWLHTADFADRGDSTRLHTGNLGVYFVAERMIWRKPGAGPQGDQGVVFFARTGFAPGDRNLFSGTADTGLSCTGLLPGREADTFGLGLAWAGIGRQTRQAERAANAAVVSDYELAFEAAYDAAINDRWHVIPDLQWIAHPGGSRALPAALVVGLRTRLAF